jgi:hypothetical protein
MGIQVSWANAQTVLITFQPGWVWDELYASVGEADRMIVNAEGTVHLIIDIRKAGGIPRDFLNVAGDLLNQGSARDNVGEKVVVGANWLIRTAYQGFLSVYGHRMEGRPLRFASNLDEAQAMLTATP